MSTTGQAVYVVCAAGEEHLAELFARPLREAGYRVVYSGTVAVGESTVGAASQELATGAPIVPYTTTRSVGSRWAHRIVRAGHAGGHGRVFVVLMEEEAAFEQLAIKRRVARYCDDPVTGVRDLLDALTKHFRPSPSR